MQPIFIIGTERSGTNLLRLMLNAHSGIAVPHPPHIMKFFTPLLPLYGDLGDDGNFRRLVADVCRMVELHPYPWEIAPDREKVVLEARDRTLISIYFALYDQYLRHAGKRRWCCKSTFMIEHVAEILAYHPEARFIFMVRDGRDVAVSAKKSIFNHFHVYFSARRWQREQRLGLDWLSRLPAGQIRLVHYEALIADPSRAVRDLCAFLGEPFEEGMLEYHRSREAEKSGSLSISWENTSRPVLAANAEKFRRELSPEEIRLFEAIAGDELATLAYPLMTPAGELARLRAEGIKPRLAYRLREAAMRLTTEVRHLRRDRNSLQRVKKLLFLRYLHLRRFTLRHV